jgi:hypothetical protein
MARRRDEPLSDLLHDPTIQDAVGRLSRRAEEPWEQNVLAATFVDPGVTRQLDNDSHQILLGRRGTGKTHVLRVMQRRFASRPSQFAVYADLTRLGSTELAPEAVKERAAAALLIDLLRLLDEEYRRRARSNFALASATPQIDALTEVITASEFARRAGSLSTTSKRLAGRGGEAKVSISATALPKAEVGAKTERSREESQSEEWTLEAFDRVQFTAVTKALDDLVQAAKIERLAILIDEWVEIPFDLQPYLAEFIKRCFLVVPRVTVKIAAIEHRSQFGTPLTRNAVRGFELQADVFTLAALDETFFFYDRDPEQVCRVLADLLYRHIAVEAALAAAKRGPGPPIPAPAPASNWARRLLDGLLSRKVEPLDPDDAIRAVAVALDRDDWADRFMENEGSRFMEEELRLRGPADFVDRLFTDDAFRDLARSAQGVVRDFLVIFYKAFHQTRHEDRVDGPAVRDAMNEVYSDKLMSLDADSKALFARVSDVVLGKGVRSFLADEELRQHETFQSLVDKRLVHPLNRRYPDSQERGRMFGIYTLDYASYAGLIDDERLADSDFTAEGNDTVAPFSDARRMRRVVLGPRDVDL